MESETIRTFIHAYAFLADYKGTCVLCLGTVKHGQPIVKIEDSVIGASFTRNVHEDCAIRFADSARLAGGEIDEEIVRPYLEGIQKNGWFLESYPDLPKVPTFDTGRSGRRLSWNM